MTSRAGTFPRAAERKSERNEGGIKRAKGDRGAGGGARGGGQRNGEIRMGNGTGRKSKAFRDEIEGDALECSHSSQDGGPRPGRTTPIHNGANRRIALIN